MSTHDNALSTEKSPLSARAAASVVRRRGALLGLGLLAALALGCSSKSRPAALPPEEA